MAGARNRLRQFALLYYRFPNRTTYSKVHCPDLSLADDLRKTTGMSKVQWLRCML